MPTLEQLGWQPFFQTQLEELQAVDPGVVPLRVAVEHRDRYRLLGVEGAEWGDLRGRLRDGADRPAVGDWVVANSRGDGTFVIEQLLQRRTRFVRQAAGRKVAVQVLASNVDVVFVVTSPNEDFNVRRLERYLTMVWASGASPVVVINKLDICADRQPYLDALESVATDVPVVFASGLHGDVDPVRAYIEPGRTAAFVGSSGVGKSTLVNRLIGEQVQETAPIREDDAKGRHITTHRELFVLSQGGILIDTPGMRELALWADSEGIEQTFADVEALAESCRFRDCGHANEPGCAVSEAVKSGELSGARLASFRKLALERQHQARRKDAADRITSRKRGKKLSKLIRSAKRAKRVKRR